MRLGGKIQLDHLFAARTSFAAGPFRVVWTPPARPGPLPLRVVFVVPKKRVRKAHDRQRIRRALREAFRTLKNPLLEQLVRRKDAIDLGIFWTAKPALPQQGLRRSMEKALRELAARLERGAATDETNPNTPQP